MIKQITPYYIEAICAVVTSITAIVAIIISVVSLRQNTKMIEESTRPLLGIYGLSTYICDRQYYLILKNFGQSAAKIISFSYDTDIAQLSKHVGIEPFDRIDGTTILPGQTFRTVIDYDAASNNGISTINFFIRYSSDSGKKYSQECSLKIDGNIGNLENHSNSKDKLAVIAETLQDAYIKSL